MAAELVNHATSEKLSEMDWMKNIEICELVARDHSQAREVVKAIKKRLGSKNSNTQLYTVMLLEMLMNNIGEHIHKQVIDAALLPILVKIVKKKSDVHVREKIFLLLDATQTSLGGASGKFPQYYDAYYNLVSAGVKFPQVPPSIPVNHPIPQSDNNHSSNGELQPPISRHEEVTQQAEPQIVPESRYIQKASNALEVLKEVLDAVDTQNPEGAKDEFTLDLVEQCSFQKQRVMHLVMTSRDEKVISRAIDLNEQLEKVLARHDDLVSGRNHSAANNCNHNEVEEEEEAEQLFRRIRKGKACAMPEGEVCFSEQHPLGLHGPHRVEGLNRPLIRPVCLEASNEPNVHPLPPVSVVPTSNNSNQHLGGVVIPPPPAKHIERERFFQENRVEVSSASGHMRGLSLHSRNGSSSRSGSTDFNE